ncbi:Hypothetical predicted protein [Octopus vulgaris]|uniref:Uncharacterized protein n=1 Tax=Octopus vulgaris TaxID=6645 RepID=A0AA36FDG9_OCTVU|nr:Hypothetical predicted protein [Octopus vulgaris]
MYLTSQEVFKYCDRENIWKSTRCRLLKQYLSIATTFFVPNRMQTLAKAHSGQEGAFKKLKTEGGTVSSGSTVSSMGTSSGLGSGVQHAHFRHHRKAHPEVPRFRNCMS